MFIIKEGFHHEMLWSTLPMISIVYHFTVLYVQTEVMKLVVII